jgi:hypothetical protein
MTSFAWGSFVDLAWKRSPTTNRSQEAGERGGIRPTATTTMNVTRFHKYVRILMMVLIPGAIGRPVAHHPPGETNAALFDSPSPGLPGGDINSDLGMKGREQQQRRSNRNLLDSDDIGVLVNGMIRRSSSNASFAATCLTETRDTADFTDGLFRCTCDAASLSITCATTEAVNVEGVANLHTRWNFTRFYAYENKELKYNTWRYCYDYYHPSTVDSQVPAGAGGADLPPQGCVETGWLPESSGPCSATLTDSNGTLRECASCARCGQLQVDIDCTNVRPLATTTHSVLHELDTCYYLYPYDTFEVFPDVVRSGSGGGGIARSLAVVGALAIRAHAATVASAASSFWSASEASVNTSSISQTGGNWVFDAQLAVTRDNHA